MKSDEDYEPMELPLAPITMKMQNSLVRKKIKKAKKKAPTESIDYEQLPDGGKEGALKAREYFRKTYKKNPKNENRKRHTKEADDFYKKIYMKGK